jgi:transcriptional regulator with XRE-family HTH domain
VATSVAPARPPAADLLSVYHEAPLGRRLAARRVLLGVTQAQVARIARLEQSRISELERGGGRLSPERFQTTLARVERALEKLEYRALQLREASR